MKFFIKFSKLTNILYNTYKLNYGITCFLNVKEVIIERGEIKVIHKNLGQKNCVKVIQYEKLSILAN